MNKKMYFQAEMKEAKQTEKGTLIRGLASTPTHDRHDDVVEPEAFRKTIGGNFAKNPIVLFQHDANRPIGKVQKMNISPNGLDVEILVVDKDIEPKLSAGILKTLSIGYVPQKVEFIDRDGEKIDTNTDEGKRRVWFEKGVKRVIKELELFEISVVSIPANPDATFAPKLFSLAKSVKKYFDLQKKEFLSTNDVDMNTKDIDLLKKEDDEVVEESESVETPEEEQGGASEEAVESPADEISGEDEGVETPAEDGAEEDEDAGESEDDTEEAEDEADESEEVEAEETESEDEVDEAKSDDEADAEDEAAADENEADEEKSIKIDPKLVTPKNMIALSKKVSALEQEVKDLKGELANTPRKKALRMSPTGIKGQIEGEEGEGEKPDEKKGFKSNFFGA